eukprot:jgi/Psemu1/2291/gm1.2291_g
MTDKRFHRDYNSVVHVECVSSALWPDDNFDKSYDPDTFSIVEGFLEYFPSTIDPSPWVLVTYLTLCALLIFLLPLCVALVQLHRRRSSEKKVLCEGFVMKRLSEMGQIFFKYYLERSDSVLALCRPDMANETDPLTRYLVKDMNILNGLEKSSAFVHYDKSSSTPDNKKVEDKAHNFHLVESCENIRLRRTPYLKAQKNLPATSNLGSHTSRIVFKHLFCILVKPLAAVAAPEVEAEAEAKSTYAFDVLTKNDATEDDEVGLKASGVDWLAAVTCLCLGLLEESWNLVEEVGGAATNASEVRIAKILGFDKPKLSKYSAEGLCALD